jgi:queuine/archaeosine tRNA-ribosyltransferase
LMKQVRHAIDTGTFTDFKAEFITRYTAKGKE